MSIIYDALQKTQRQLNIKNQFPKKQPGKNWFDWILISVICILLVVTGIAYYPLVIRFFHKSPPQPVQSIQHPTKPQPKLILNGIFVSDKEKLAQINNKLLTVGESIDGNRIIEITSTTVKLLNNNSVITLKNDPSF